MKFGVFCPRARTERLGSAEGAYDLLLRAEEQGYESAWLGEAVVDAGSAALPVFVPAANLAARTQRIRVGVALSLGADLHPLRLCEEIAALDVMTGGRVEWAAAWHDREDAEEGSGPGASRSGEQLAIALHAWTHERFEWRGKFYSFPEVECVPPPVQVPPPTWVLSGDPVTRDWAVRAGHLAMLPPLAGLSSSDAGPARAALRHVYVGATLERARDEATESLLRAYRGSGAVGMGGRPVESGAELEALLEDRAAVGDAAYCRERIAEWRERAALGSLILYQDFGDLSTEALLASQIRFLEEVAPSFA